MDFVGFKEEFEAFGRVFELLNRDLDLRRPGLGLRILELEVEF